MSYKIDILDTVRKRFEHNQNWLCMIAGDTGTSKSWTGIKIASSLDDNFTIDNVAFNTKELTQLIKTLPRRSVVMMDEAGVSYSARESMSIDNIMVSKIFQAFRFKQIALIWTLPDTHQIDVNARRLLHNYLETMSIDYEHNLSRVKWFEIHIDRWKGNVYQRYPRIRTPSGVKVVTMVKFGKPPEDLIKLYEEKKQKAFCELIESCERSFSGESRRRGRTIPRVQQEAQKPTKFYTEPKIPEGDVIEIEVL